MNLLCYKSVNCVFPACPVACDEGAMRCFANTDDSCCNFYDPANGKCLIECPSDRTVTEDFDCAGEYTLIVHVLPCNKY